MTRPDRLSVCYVDPGRDFRRGSSHCREALALSRALGREAEVSLVFRRLCDNAPADGCIISALESPGRGERAATSRRALGRFVEQRAAAFDLVLEATWAMPGKVTAWCNQRGIAAIPVLDGLPSTSWLGSFDPGGAWLGIGSSGRYLRRATAIVAASEALRDVVVDRWRVDPQQIVVIGPAIDRTLFSPRDQTQARRTLGMAPEHRILLAGDGFGTGPDLAPLIEAVQRAGDPALRLHVVGDGPKRAALQRIAGADPSVTFHGTVADHELATYIAASDLCVSLDSSGGSCYSALECLSSARPVVVPAQSVGRPPRLHHAETGFVVEHDVLSWIRFLQRDCPSRNTLRMMGMAASGTPIEHATRTADAYLAVIDRVCRASRELTAVV